MLPVSILLVYEENILISSSNNIDITDYSSLVFGKLNISM